MSNIIMKLIQNPNRILLHFSRPLEAKGFFDSIPDEKWIPIRYWLRMGKFPNLEEPKLYTEKLQWIKLHDRNPLYTILVDKYEVKSYVSKIIGNEYIIPTLGVWDKFEDIDFNDLPNQFVLKTTHDSNSTVICKNREDFDIEHARKLLSKSLKNNYYLRMGREWPYKNVKPRIMAEKYMEDKKTGELRDYKFFVFDGVCHALFVASDRQKQGEEVKFDYYDANFNKLDITTVHPHSKEHIEKPTNFSAMKKIAELLGKGIPHVRVDLYEVDGSIYFGELTFFHFSGSTPFEPQSWDKTFGDWLRLPSI